MLDKLGLARSRSRSISRSPPSSRDPSTESRTPTSTSHSSNSIAARSSTSPLPSYGVRQLVEAALKAGTSPATLAGAATGTGSQSPHLLASDRRDEDESALEDGSDARSVGHSQNNVLEFSFPSLLSPPNPAFIAGGESRGILLNARRPSRERHTPFTSAESSDTSPRSPDAPVLGERPVQSGLTATRPTLRVTSSADPLGYQPSTVASPEAVVQDITLNSTDQPSGFQDSLGSASSRKIRFAPLPDPRRPRRYSTGRDVWVEEDDHLHLKPSPETSSLLKESISASSLTNTNSLASDIPADAKGISLPASVRDPSDPSRGEQEDLATSWASSASSSKGGHRRSLSQGSSPSVSSSVTKFLSPLKLGRSKSKEAKSNGEPTSPPSTKSSWLPSFASGEPLSRAISAEFTPGQTQAERERKEEFRPTGIAMRKSNTADSDRERSRPRPVYPSVAQGGVRRANIRRVPAGPTPEPEFREWSQASIGSVSRGGEDDEDDGSGLAWVKKRRREREAREKAEQEERQKQIQPDSSPRQKESQSSAPSPADVGLRTTDYTASESGQATSPGHLSELGLKQGLPTRAYQVTAQVPLGPEAGKEQRDVIGAPMDGHRAADDDDAVEDDDAETEDADADEGEDGDEAEGNEDGDLTAAELEEEERLMEEARRTTEGAGREKYHDHEHHSSTYHVKAPTPLRRTSMLSRTSTMNSASNKREDTSRNLTAKPPSPAQ